MYMVGPTPSAAGMGLGTIRDDGGGPWSRARALGCQSVEMGGGVRVPVGVKGEV